jgi:hypothetical protein
MTLPELLSAVGVKRSAAQRILEEINVQKVGSGKKGDPYRWFFNDKNHSAQTHTQYGQKEMN